MKQTLAAFAALTILPAAALAQDIPATTLRLADAYPTKHVISTNGAQSWIKSVEQLSGGKIKIEFFPAQQLGKAADLLRLVQTGVADVGSIGPAYVSDKMPLSDVAALPGMFEDVCRASAAYQTLALGGVLQGEEYTPNGVRALFTGVMPPYQIISPRHRIDGVASLKGLKIRASGGSSDILVRTLGGIPVKMAGPDIREGLDRGTVDANLGPNSSLRPYDIFPLAKFGTQGFPLGSFVLTYAISEKKWSQLAAPVRKVLTDAAKLAQQDLCKAMEAENVLAIKDMEAMGSKFHYATPADIAEVQKISAVVVEEWQKQLDARGKPGSRAVAEFRAALKN